MGYRSSIAGFPGAARLSSAACGRWAPAVPGEGGTGQRRAVFPCARRIHCGLPLHPSLPPPSSPAGARPQCAAVRVGAEGGRDRGQAGGLGWFGFSLIIIFIRASTKFCGKCASAPRAVSWAGLICAGGRGENAGRVVRAGLLLGGRGSALERQGVLDILLGCPLGVGLSALLPQMRERRGERCYGVTWGDSRNLRRVNADDVGDPQPSALEELLWPVSRTSFSSVEVCTQLGISGGVSSVRKLNTEEVCVRDSSICSCDCRVWNLIATANCFWDTDRKCCILFMAWQVYWMRMPIKLVAKSRFKIFAASWNSIFSLHFHTTLMFCTIFSGLNWKINLKYDSCYNPVLTDLY